MSAFKFWNGVRTSVYVTITAAMMGGVSGETSWNAMHLLQGQTNIPLSEVGIEQATKLGRHLKGKVKFTKAYSSDLIRAYTTASLILMESQDDSTPPLTIITDVQLRERNFGDGEGLPVHEYNARAAKANTTFMEYIPNGSEPPSDVRKRAGAFFNKLCESSIGISEDKNVLIVSHGIWIHALMEHLNNCGGRRYTLINFSPLEAIKVPHNTGVAVMHITPIPDKSAGNTTPNYEVKFLQVNNFDHLS